MNTWQVKPNHKVVNRVQKLQETYSDPSSPVFFLLLVQQNHQKSMTTGFIELAIDSDPCDYLEEIL